jgi:hypothetical protein
LLFDGIGNEGIEYGIFIGHGSNLSVGFENLDNASAQIVGKSEEIISVIRDIHSQPNVIGFVVILGFKHVNPFRVRIIAPVRDEGLSLI